jgi:hypothetical protein
MNMRFVIAVTAALLAFGPMPASADPVLAPDGPAPVIQVVSPSVQPCPLPTDARMEVAQVSQTDCCKGHKGVCGCRAGKIVCCDGTGSPNCTCHSDWGVAD